MNWLNMTRKKFPLMIWQIVLTALSVFSMTSMVALLQFDVHALEETFSASPSSCNVGDTITLTYSGGYSGSTYQYSYSTNNGSTWVGITSDFDDITTYSFVPSEEGTFIFKVVIKYFGGSFSNKLSDPVIVSSAESSVESSDESSDESSFTPMQWLPGWEGQQYVQPSADSTPTLELSLPSDVQFSVSDGIGGVLSSAFQAFPAPLLGLIIPSVICLFVGWWLHK